MDYFAEIQKYIEVPYLIVFMAFAYAFKDILTAILTHITKTKVSKTWTVFLIGTLVAIPCWYVWDMDKLKLVITWSVGTALHQLAFKYIEDTIKTKKS